MCATKTVATVQNQHTHLPPVITIDGPSGTGKGTLSQLAAKTLGWHYLDSGSLYRVLAFAALQQQLALAQEEPLVHLAHTLDIQFPENHGEIRIILAGQDISDAIRSELCGNTASRISVFPKVRRALLDKQRAFRKPPGLITDGRDMGTVIFPDAQPKFFLTASVEERAQRRYRQLKKAGVHVSLERILRDIEQRDMRDQQRSVAPLKPAPDAIIIDTTELSIHESLDCILLNIKTSLGLV
jgi:cytidylate kinase